MSAICSEISSVALAVWLASDLTSDATTAKPLPASPACAASMVAFSANRLVCAAVSLISLTTSPMRPGTFRQAPHSVVGLLGFLHRACADLGGLRHLTADFGHRGA